MSDKNSSSFPVRHYECDAYGHLNNITYVRYLHEAILASEAATGHDLAWYAALGRRWQTRRLTIDYLRPAQYGDTVAVAITSAVSDPTTIRRTGELRLVPTADLVAQAQVEAILLDTVTGQPMAIGPEFARALGGNDPPDPLPPLPPLMPPPPGIFITRRRVAWQDLDLTRHVADATLLAYVEACGFAVVAAYGWPAERMAAQGFAIILRRHVIEHFIPAELNDEVEVATWASDVKRVSAIRHYTMRRCRDGALLSRVDTLGVWVDLTTGRPIRIPSPCLADFAPNTI